jgi:hypothetical protein
VVGDQIGKGANRKAGPARELAEAVVFGKRISRPYLILTDGIVAPGVVILHELLRSEISLMSRAVPIKVGIKQITGAH